MTVLKETGAARPAGQTAARMSHDPQVRLAALFDAGTVETMVMSLDGSARSSAGILAASGRINGVAVIGFACDPRIQGGAMGAESCAVIVRAYQAAVSRKMPVIGLWQS